MERPVAFIDIESSGTDVAVDKIVTLAIIQSDSIRSAGLKSHLFQANPGIQMTQEVIDIHGITNEMAATYPPFSESAIAVHALVDGRDIAGFGITQFDIALLYEELARCDIEWNLTGIRFFDASVIFKKKEERTLAAAMKFFCGQELVGAHGALADAEASRAVLLAQLQRYPDLAEMNDDQLAEFARFNNNVDLAGKIIIGPTGEPTYNIGKAKGVRVIDDPGFGWWMISKEFSGQTKKVLRDILGSNSPRLDGAF